MSWKNTEHRYGSLSIKMHWLMVFLMVLVFASIEGRQLFEKGTELRDLFKMWHFMLGLLVLALMTARVYLRFSQVTPKIMPPLTAVQELGAKAAHLMLYVFMIAMPIAGWLILSAEGKPVPFFGLELPPLIDTNKELAESIEELHETVGEIGYYLIGLHAIAALVHHYVQKDDTLLRMLPKK
ncbi:cytochrome b [Litorilituus lipolyticus]|uniref:Cytochrome b n=1 Tax=Litorilituus lipolyticus TaxID=2491017 RepID=A0A502L2D4_9GAMM|nr:cytochrome b [Litorilituus lipolyticus]TPH18032.1 cytochrome b [Litorilituus lipolyticus]